MIFINKIAITLLSLFLMMGLILPNFSFAQDQPIKAPETVEEAKELGKKVTKTAEKEMPGILEKIWKEEVIPIWQSMWDWTKKVWKSYLEPKLDILYQKIRGWLGREVEKRKPAIEKELGKEKKEMKRELKETVPEVSKSLWQRFKELLK